MLTEWAVSSSGGLWHDCDVFCCCFNHRASCFSVMARAVLIMKNVLPSFPLNQRDVESSVVAAPLNLLEVLSYVNTGDGKKAELLITESSNKHTRVCAFWPAGRIQNGEMTSVMLFCRIWVCGLMTERRFFKTLFL